MDSSISMAKGPFPFLRLPAELRNRVYDFAMLDTESENDKICLFYKTDPQYGSARYIREQHGGQRYGKGPEIRSKSYFSLIQVCRQIRNEFRPLFYGVWAPVIGFHILPKFLTTFAPAASTPTLGKITAQIDDYDLSMRLTELLHLLRARARTTTWSFRVFRPARMDQDRSHSSSSMSLDRYCMFLGNLIRLGHFERNCWLLCPTRAHYSGSRRVLYEPGISKNTKDSISKTRSPESRPCTMPFPFLLLPAEVRNQIYEHIAYDVNSHYAEFLYSLHRSRNDHLHFYRGSGHVCRRYSSGYLDLVYVCRQIRDEVFPLYPPTIRLGAHVVIEFDDLSAFLTAFLPSRGSVRTLVTKVTVMVKAIHLTDMEEYDMLPLIITKALHRRVQWEFRPSVSVGRPLSYGTPAICGTYFDRPGLRRDDPEPRQLCESLNRVLESLNHDFMNDIRSRLFSGFLFRRRDSSGFTTKQSRPVIWE